MIIAASAIAGSSSSLKISFRLSRFSTATSLPFVMASITLMIMALRVAFVFLAIHLLIYAMIFAAVSSSSSAVIFKIPPFFLIAYLICLNFGSSISGKSFSSSTLSNGTDSASTSMFRVPLFVVTPSVFTYCSRLSADLLNSIISVLISSGIVIPIPSSLLLPGVTSDEIASLYTSTSFASGSVPKNPALTMLTKDFTRFFLSCFTSPPTFFAVPF